MAAAKAVSTSMIEKLYLTSSGDSRILEVNKKKGGHINVPFFFYVINIGIFFFFVFIAENRMLQVICIILWQSKTC